MNLLVLGDQNLTRFLTDALSRLKVRVEGVEDEKSFLRKLSKSPKTVIVDEDFAGVNIFRKSSLLAVLKRSKHPFIVLSPSKDTRHIASIYAAGAADTIVKPFSTRELVMRVIAVAERKKHIACIGGGTGLFTLLLGLKTLPNALLTSIVNMSDDGGSSGKLSQSFGILPPGDIRRSLVALSNAPEVMNQIMQYRFDRGGELRGHSFGNIFLTVLAQVKGSMPEAVRALSDILNIQGIVLPATTTLTTLVAKFENGHVERGESKIDLCEGRRVDLKITKLWRDPEPDVHPDAYASILHADVVIIGPGDLYTSIISNLGVNDLRHALLTTKAKIIYVCNLMTKPGETAAFDAADHVREIVRSLGKDILHTILISNSKLSSESIHEYSKKNQIPVTIKNKLKLQKATKAKIVYADIGNETELVRHDSMKLRNEIEKLMGRLR